MSTGQGSAEIGIGIGTTLNCNHEAPIVTHALRGEGFDASEDGTGRRTPLVPVAIQNALRGDAQNGLGVSEDDVMYTLDQGSQHAVAIQAGALRENSESGPDGVGVRTDGIAYTLEARAEVQAVAFSCKDHGADAGDMSPTLRSMGHDGSHANAGGQVAVMTLAIRGRDGKPSLEVREDGIANAVLTPNGGRAGIGVGAVAISANQRGELRERPVHGSLSASKSAKQFDGVMQNMAVRRLTPRECERLQGFPDDYTKINTKTADGPRYKALGNSMAVPVMSWIGKRIQMVEGMTNG